VTGSATHFAGPIDSARGHRPGGVLVCEGCQKLAKWVTENLKGPGFDV